MNSDYLSDLSAQVLSSIDDRSVLESQIGSAEEVSGHVAALEDNKLENDRRRMGGLSDRAPFVSKETPPTDNW